MGYCSKCTTLIALISIIGPFVWVYRDQRAYNFRTTANEAADGADFSGKVIIVTGANTGIGKPTAKTLLSHGATVVMACRNKMKSTKARTEIIDEIIAENPADDTNRNVLENNLDLITLDLASFESIEQFCKEFEKKYKKLNYLVLNAGISRNSWSPTKEGIETNFGVNHIGHFLLTMRLTQMMIETGANDDIISRVIVVASYAQIFSYWPLNDWLSNDSLIQNKDVFVGSQSYGFSKLCNILFAKEYNLRYKDEGVFAVSVHPGTISTELVRDKPFFMKWFWQNVVGKTIFKSKEQGAATTIRTIAITDEEFKKSGGEYYSDCNIASGQLRSDLYPNVSENAMPQKLLWKLTETMIEDYTLQ